MWCNIKELLLLLLSVSLSSSVFDYTTTKVISLGRNGSYFGFSLLLQGGHQSFVIVGAPKSRDRFNKITGSVHKCSIDTLECTEYHLRNNNNDNLHLRANGDLFGANLEGGDTVGSQFFTCAPRYIIKQDSANVFSKGLCYRINNSSTTIIAAEIINSLQHFRPVGVAGFLNYYDSAFGEGGFDIHYLKGTNQLLIGAPGMVDWTGAVIETDFRSNQHRSFSSIYNSMKFTYFGYSVASGQFTNRSDVTWYVAGVPRGFSLKGEVVLFEKSTSRKLTIRQELIGEEFGSYFGASILVVPKKYGDDLLVGAPMHSGKSWDEGCVYYYKNINGKLQQPFKLLGGRQAGARFGSSMSNLGYIDLDLNNVIAISAPYEDNGVGVVYTYHESSKGYTQYQRISPSLLQIKVPSAVKGFGLGLSNAKDIDGNKHSDIVIGAYGSDQIFIIRSADIAESSFEITPNISVLLATTKEFDVRYCVTPILRSQIKKALVFNLLLLISDERVENEMSVIKNVTAISTQKICLTHKVKLKTDFTNTNNIEIEVGSKFPGSEIYSQQKLEIPFSHGCGEDNICQVDLSIKAISNLSEVVLGANNQLEIKVNVENSGETALQVELYVKIPEKIDLINLRECNLFNSSYIICLISKRMATLEKHNKSFLLDVGNLYPTTRTLSLHIEVRSLGVENHKNNNYVKLNVPVILRNSPFIDSKSTPEGLTYVNNKGKRMSKIEFSHVFIVGNAGPSPVDMGLVLLVPKLQFENQQLFEINSVEGTVNNIQTECQLRNVTKNYASFKHNTTILNSLGNHTYLISCIEDFAKCQEIYCPGGYFYKSSETATFTLKISANVALLTKAFKIELISQDTIAFKSIAYFNNGTVELQSSTITLIYGLGLSDTIPLWVYIASVISGIIVLILMIFGLYKCHFFKRHYKEKLINQQISDEDQESEVFEGGELQLE